jgi:hypothetical protein
MVGDKDRGQSRCRASELARLSPILRLAALAVGQRVLVQFDQVAHRLDMDRQRVTALRRMMAHDPPRYEIGQHGALEVMALAMQ